MPTIKYKLKNGKPVRGATTIKGQNVGWGKSPLMYWANKQGREGKTLQEAYNTATVPGTIAHMMVELYLKGMEIEHNPEWSDEDFGKAKTAFDNFKVWTDQFEFQPVEVEPNWVSEVYEYGGTPDVIGLAKKKICIIDWKTGKIYEDIFLQLAAYENLANEQGYEIEGFHVLRIPKNEDVPSFHHSHWASLPAEAWDAFQAALRLNHCEKVLKEYM